MTMTVNVEQRLAEGLIAEGARIAPANAGECAICQYPIAGDRVARLVSNRQFVHVVCIALHPGKVAR